MPCLFLLLKEKVKCVWALRGQKGDLPTWRGKQAPEGGTVEPISGAPCSAWHLDSPICTRGSHADTQALQAGRGSKVSPCPLVPLRGATHAPQWVTEGLVSRQRPSGRCVGSRERNSCDQPGCLTVFQPLALILQSSSGPILPKLGLHMTSCPLSCSRVGLAQKMLCRRFFPRPGCWKAKPR